MSESVRLNMAEKLLLLSYIEEKGRISYLASGTIRYIFVAASLLELCMKKRLRVEDKKVVLQDMSSTGDPVLDEMLSKISEKYDPKGCTHWLTTLSTGLQKKLVNRLLDKGILWEDYVSFLALFTKMADKLSDTRDFKALHEKVRVTLLTDMQKFTSEDVILVAMLKNSNILSLHLDPKEMKQSRERVKSFLKDEGLLERVMGRELLEAYKAVNKGLAEVKAAT